MDIFLEYLRQIDPLWSVVIVAVVLGGFVAMKLSSAGYLRILAGAGTLAAVGVIAGSGYHSYLKFEESRRIEERRAFDRRAEALFGKAGEPDSVLACIDGSGGPAMREECERRLFADATRVAAAVAIVTQRLAFLDAATAFAARRDPDYARRIEPMRRAIEADPYGFVAFAFSVERSCTLESCTRLTQLREPARVKENMRVRRMEAFLAKHASQGGSAAIPAPSPAAAVARTSSPFVTIVGPPNAAPSTDSLADPLKGVIAPMIVPPSAATVAVDPPAAASAPSVTRPLDTGFAAPSRPAVRTAPAKSSDGAQAKGRAKATGRSPEPVAGLPRVVPSDYIRDQEEEAEPQTSAQHPAEPTPILPRQQNFIGR